MPVSCWARTAAVKITISLSAAQLRYVRIALLVLPSAHCSVLRWLCTEPVLMRLAPCSSQRVSVLTVLTVSAFPREAGVRARSTLTGACQVQSSRLQRRFPALDQLSVLRVPLAWRCSRWPCGPQSSRPPVSAGPCCGGCWRSPRPGPAVLMRGWRSFLVSLGTDTFLCVCRVPLEFPCRLYPSGQTHRTVSVVRFCQCSPDV